MRSFVPSGGFFFLLSLCPSGFSMAESVSYTYDGAGRLLKAIYESKTIAYTYDKNGSLTGRSISPTSSPVCYIRANGSDSAITVPSGSPVSIAIALDSGDQAGQNADWWVIKYGPDGWSYLGISEGSLLFLPGLLVTYPGPLFNFPSFEIFNTSGLPVGAHIFCFAVDLNMNSSLDTSPLYYDWVSVNVTGP